MLELLIRGVRQEAIKKISKWKEEWKVLFIGDAILLGKDPELCQKSDGSETKFSKVTAYKTEA